MASYYVGHDALQNFISTVIVIMLCSVHCGLQECVQILTNSQSIAGMTMFGNTHKPRIASHFWKACLLLRGTDVPVCRFI